MTTTLKCSGDQTHQQHQRESIVDCELRLKDADEILRKAREENADMYDDLRIVGTAVGSSRKDEKSLGSDDNDATNMEDGKNNYIDNNENNDGGEENTKSDSVAQSAETKDMLVMRLDDSIENVMKSITSAVEAPSEYVVNKTVDSLAQEIETMEVRAKSDWIDNHSVIDNDGRARCSAGCCSVSSST